MTSHDQSIAPAVLPRMVVWFSCGAASAVAAKLCLSLYGGQYDIAVARCVVINEHHDNNRFADHCARWLGVPILSLMSRKYMNCWEVWEQERYLVGVHGAPCTKHMKRNVRLEFERRWCPDVQVYGYTYEEKGRVERFRENNPEIELLTPLIDMHLSKADCLAMIQRADISLPAMYLLGFNNNNCVGCVKGGKGYWNRVRRHFPHTFARMAGLERRLNATVLYQDEEKLFLDKLPPTAGRHKESKIDCSLFCYSAERIITPAHRDV